MVFVFIPKEPIDKILQNKIIEHIKVNLKFNKIRYKLVICDKYIIESKLPKITNSDFILWNPELAYSNLELVKNFNNSIVILLNKTLLNRKVSELNPVNELLAINHCFLINYIQTEIEDITNNEYKLILQEDNYLITTEDLINLIKKDKLNIIYGDVDITPILNKNHKTKQINLT